VKLATIQIDGLPCAAALDGGRLALLASPGTDLGALLRQGRTLADFQRLAAAATKFVDLDQAVFLSPSIEPPKILCVGLNYADHTKESPYEQPDYPTLFLRVATSLGAHGAVVERPAVSDTLDFEGEMVGVLGKGGRRIPKERALEHVFGYAAGNEISVREFQFKSPQWTVGKNFDGTGTWGPCVVTADELPAGASGLRVETRLNGTTVQSASTADMLFDVATVISTVSQALTLQAGDIIFSGTPAGVGFGRTPKLYMKDGDTVEVEIERIGLLRNTIRDEPRSA
jgi:2-keto-4-pentenoate hydratase/2-oxohepta-3-ene-1,7-dioic acid hydratase in catechol pathway